MNHVANLKLIQVYKKKQFIEIKTLSNELRNKFINNKVRIKYKSKTYYNFIFNIKNITADIDILDDCVFLVRLYEDDIKLDYFTAIGIDTVAIMIKSFDETVHLAKIMNDDFIVQSTAHTVCRGEIVEV